MASQENSVKHFGEELTLILSKLFQKIAEEGKLPNLFKRPPSPWYQNQTETSHENRCRPTELMNIDAKILNKIPAIRIQQYIGKIIRHDEMGPIPGMQGFFSVHKSISVIHHINKSKNLLDMWEKKNWKWPPSRAADECGGWETRYQGSGILCQGLVTALENVAVLQ